MLIENSANRVWQAELKDAGWCLPVGTTLETPRSWSIASRQAGVSGKLGDLREGDKLQV